MKLVHGSPIVFAALAALAACTAPSSSSEAVGEAREAIVSGGIGASLTATPNGSANVPVLVTVTNNSANPASNWQVQINLNQSSLTGGASGQVELNVIGGALVLSPNRATGTLGPGASYTFGFQVSPTGSNWTPTIAMVDGVADGAAGAGVPGNGVDPIAQAVATGAFNVAIAYANNKLQNNGDTNYAQYDSFLWSSQAYVISGSTIVFDTNVPGYAFIPNQAKAELAFMQRDPSVAAYLVDGLQSCFANVAPGMIYGFRPGVLKGYRNNTTTTGTLGGLVPLNGDQGGYNPANVVDQYSTVGLMKGGTTVTSTLTSTTAHPDEWFGILVAENLATFGNPSAITEKYWGADGAACTPFNGPGGSANPSFAISMNGQSVATRFSGIGAYCMDVCTSQLVIDPIGYATPGPQYDANGNLLGPGINPFTLNPSNTEATVDHEAQWAIRTANGVQTWGQFTRPVTLFGVTMYQFVVQ